MSRSGGGGSGKGGDWMPTNATRTNPLMGIDSGLPEKSSRQKRRAAEADLKRKQRKAAKAAGRKKR